MFDDLRDEIEYLLRDAYPDSDVGYVAGELMRVIERWAADEPNVR